MISSEILHAISIGILTDDQLKDALKHYKELEALLKPHGEKYHLVWKDVYFTLTTLEEFYINRKQR